ncbi:MAG TPA: integrase core domain-containing protein [Candidatus Dormibacteraeota bacterium]|nr:integrase core domain-containing protein [Candidatus Dormibacteraeota bacterium]
MHAWPKRRELPALCRVVPSCGRSTPANRALRARRIGRKPAGVSIVALSASQRVIRPPLQAPQANAYAERWVGSARRECLDWLIVGGRRHLEQVLDEYVDHYNNERPHRGLQLQPPNGRLQGVSATGPIRSRARLGGLFREYSRAVVAA